MQPAIAAAISKSVKKMKKTFFLPLAPADCTGKTNLKRCQWPSLTPPMKK
jgi:hypothetical protein